jgi:hypothetical protein
MQALEHIALQENPSDHLGMTGLFHSQKSDF